jgi:hypothetical protein
MMTSHGVVQGYNSQALIDGKHQVIVQGEAFGDGQDHGHVPPMLTGALENLQSIGHEPDYFERKILTADSNYHTLVNLQKCQELGLDAYIPDRQFRNRDPRFATQKRRQVRRFTLKDFRYEEALDQYICPDGKILKLRVKRVLNRGHLYRKYYAAEKDCQACPLIPSCVLMSNMIDCSKNYQGGSHGKSYQEQPPPFQRGDSGKDQGNSRILAGAKMAGYLECPG